MSEKRFELTINPNGQADIKDNVESKEKNAICIYNDLGVIPFTSAKAVCDLLNEQDTKIKQLNRLAETNEEQTLNIMTYLHDNHYEIWEEVNQKCFGDVND